MKPKKLFVCTDHDGHYPVGVASIVLADNKDEARELLDMALSDEFLKQYDRHTYTLREVSLKDYGAHILCNGNY